MKLNGRKRLTGLKFYLIKFRWKEFSIKIFINDVFKMLQWYYFGFREARFCNTIYSSGTTFFNIIPTLIISCYVRLSQNQVTLEVFLHFSHQKVIKLLCRPHSSHLPVKLFCSSLHWLDRVVI